MFIYQNVNCPYCGEPILPDDEIVVCPECGTPHHRHCYFENGHCYNEALHSDSFEWENPNSSSSVDSTEVEKRCPVCGEIISSNELVCHNCGSQLPQTLPSYSIQDLLNMEEEQRKEAAEESGRFVLKSTDTIDGVTVRDLLLYFKNINYVAIFCKQELTGNKISFSLPALFSPTLFFLYNKVWLVGIISMILSVILSIPDGMIVYYRMTGNMVLNIPLSSWDSLSSIFSILSLIINIFFALFGMYILRQNAIRRIKKLKSMSNNDDELRLLILNNAPPSKFVIFLMVIYIMFLLFSILYF